MKRFQIVIALASAVSLILLVVAALQAEKNGRGLGREVSILLRVARGFSDSLHRASRVPDVPEPRGGV